MTVASADLPIGLWNPWWEMLDIILEDHDGHSLLRHGELALLQQGQAEKRI